MAQVDPRFKGQILTLTRNIREHYRPQKIILYGSLAKHKATRDSDIDIFIIKSTRKRFLDRIKEVFSMVDSDIPIEPIVYTPSEVRRRLSLGDTFVGEILKEGVLLYEKK